jgi:hypothetical protein
VTPLGPVQAIWTAWELGRVADYLYLGRIQRDIQIALALFSGHGILERLNVAFKSGVCKPLLSAVFLTQRMERRWVQH